MYICEAVRRGASPKGFGSKMNCSIIYKEKGRVLNYFQRARPLALHFRDQGLAALFYSFVVFADLPAIINLNLTIFNYIASPDFHVFMELFC